MLSPCRPGTRHDSHGESGQADLLQTAEVRAKVATESKNTVDTSCSLRGPLVTSRREYLYSNPPFTSELIR